MSKQLNQDQFDLLKAADTLEANKWCQGVSHRGINICAMTALWIAANDNRYRVIAASDRFASVHGINLQGYNDRSGRTKAEVVEAMRKAALA